MRLTSKANVNGFLRIKATCYYVIAVKGRRAKTSLCNDVVILSNSVRMSSQCIYQLIEYTSQVFKINPIVSNKIENKLSSSRYLGPKILRQLVPALYYCNDYYRAILTANKSYVQESQEGIVCCIEKKKTNTRGGKTITNIFFSSKSRQLCLQLCLLLGNFFTKVDKVVAGGYFKNKLQLFDVSTFVLFKKGPIFSPL